MGFWDIVKRPVTNLVSEPRYTYMGAANDRDQLDQRVASILRQQGLNVGDLGRLSVAQLWSTQPYLRTVVAFIARNIAQLSLNTFSEDDTGTRIKDKTCRAAKALRRPGDRMTTYDLVYATVGDVLLYDRAYWFVFTDSNGADRIRRVPPPWVTAVPVSPFEVGSYLVAAGVQSTEVPPEQLIDFTGYAPADPFRGSPTIDALRATLQEQIEATTYRLATWKRGGRVSAVLQRPADAPQWSDNAREAFREDWYAQYTGTGPRAGGTPILEDGMTLNRIDFTAKEQQFIDAAKLALNTVASAFHVPPPMIGLLDNANYANTREFRKMLYGDTLGPTLRQITDRLNTDLFTMLDDGDGIERHVDFNVADRIQGTFEEQLVAMQSAVGRPYITADEARSRLHMPPLGDGADQLVTPLNVVTGGQASPQDSGTQNTVPDTQPKQHAPHVKAAIADAQRARIERVLKAFMQRQGSSVLSDIGANADWQRGFTPDGDQPSRWDAELADELTKVSHDITTTLGVAEAKRLGYPDGYDAARTVEYLKTVMSAKASGINGGTQQRVQDELDADDGNPVNVFSSDNIATRAVGLAVGLGTFAASFSTGEAARQIAYDNGGSPKKTWIAGSNPRPSHAEMDGETVGIDEPFSNGCMWPADGADVDETAGCNCQVEITF